MARPRKPPPKPERRTRGAGSVSFDEKRRQYRARLPRDRDGKRRSEYFWTEAEAEAWIANRLSAGLDSFDPSRTLGEFLNYWWAISSPRWKPLTRRRYRYEAAAAGPIATIPLNRLRPDHIELLIAAILERGTTRRYANNVARLVCRALASAVAWRILSENVALATVYPKPEPTMSSAWDADEVKRVLAHLAGHRFEGPFLLILYGGVRMGELLGLRWDDIDWAEGTVSVQRAEWTAVARQIGTVKYDRSRVVDVPASILARVRAWRDRQAILSPWVMGRPDGGRWKPTLVRREWYALQGRAGVRRLRVHGGRHTFATGHMVAGTSLADLAVMMGHSSAAVTAQTYLSSSKRRRKAAAEALEALFSGDSDAIGTHIGPQTAPLTRKRGGTP